jgi:hypothetical protein
MEYRRRSLWNRLWENDSLDSLGREEYVRRVYEGTGEHTPWKEVCHGILLSLWKGVRWVLSAGANTVHPKKMDGFTEEDV